MSANDDALQLTFDAQDSGFSWFWFITVNCIAIVVFAAIAFILAKGARRLPTGIPRVVKIIACGTLAPTFLLGLGFYNFVDNMSVAEWIAARPPRAWLSIALFMASGCCAAWLVLRERSQTIQPSVFE